VKTNDMQQLIRLPLLLLVNILAFNCHDCNAQELEWAFNFGSIEGELAEALAATV
jgi:hypothetical protein